MSRSGSALLAFAVLCSGSLNAGAQDQASPAIGPAAKHIPGKKSAPHPKHARSPSDAAADATGGATRPKIETPQIKSKDQPVDFDFAWHGGNNTPGSPIMANTVHTINGTTGAAPDDGDVGSSVTAGLKFKFQ
jgi:hypothetical protein